MSLAPGTRLGHYSIVTAVGAGGMGEVHRATDTTLGRDVAIKILPAAFAADRDRLSRFEREARTLASLNHPNIAHVYGFEHATLPDGSACHFVAMELVEGEDLAQRLERGAIPLHDTIAIAWQIAEALEEAHDRGIVHRDLKPANVKVTAGGRVKVLDFGLAKALEGDAGHASGSGSGQPAHSPTMTRGTVAGMILGTAAYMSPEQARGRPVDERADIWSFGVVLFEMLTGRRLFGASAGSGAPAAQSQNEAESVSDILAAVLTRELDWRSLPPSTPAAIHRLLRRCLERDLRKRLHHFGDVRLELEEASAPSGPAEAAPVVGQRRRRAAAAGVAAVLGIAAGSGGVWSLTGRPAVPPVVRVAVALPATDELVQQASGLAITPDGARIVFRLAQRGLRGLFSRSLGELEPRLIPSTEEGTAPFISPDGRWIGFFTIGTSARADALNKIRVDGGMPTRLAPIQVSSGLGWALAGHWYEEGQILVSGASPVIQRVSASGGSPIAVTALDEARGEQSHVQPRMLPGGTALLYVAALSTGRQDVVAASIDGTRKRVLVEGGAGPRFLPTGHLLFVRETTLFAVPFDPVRLELEGDPLPVVEGLKVMVYGSYRQPQLDVSPLGALAYLSEDHAARDANVVFVDRGGRARIAFEETGAFLVPRLSPDGRRLAYTAIDLPSGQRDVWVRDLERGTRTRLTFGPALSTDPVWSPDGRTITFASSRAGGVLQLFSVAADGGQEPVPLARRTAQTPVARVIFPRFWLPGGEALVVQSALDSMDIGIWRKGAESEQWLFATPFGELEPSLSPDGRHIAWVSDESGRREVYMRPLSGDSRQQVSSDGGDEPVWSPRGGELFYRRGAQMVAVEVSAEGRLGASTVLFEGQYEIDPFANDATNYDVTKDGRHFIMIRRVVDSDRARQQLNVVLNWFEELKAALSGR
jgi:serine/threonine-protein kinase